MVNTHKKNSHMDSLTVGVIVESLKPSHFRAVIGTSVTIVIVVFSFGFWVAQTKADLDMRAHLIKDNEDHMKNTEEQGKLQRRVETLESSLKNGGMEDEGQQNSQSMQLVEDPLISSRPKKESALLKVAPKSNR